MTRVAESNEERELMATGNELVQVNSPEHVSAPDPECGSDEHARTGLRVVIPLDCSELSEQSLGIGQTLAHLLGGTIELVHVVDPSTSASTSLAERVRQAEDYLMEQVTRIDADIPAKFRVLHGDPVEELLKRLSGAASTIVAMSTHGRSGLQRFLFGSVADKVIRGVTVPVAVVRHGTSFSPSLRNLTLPLDGSEIAAGAVPVARSLACDDCTFGLVRVIDETHAYENMTLKYGSIWSDPELMTEINLSAEEEARESLADIAQQLRAAGYHATWEVRMGRPGDEIIRAAETTGSDLIVMATHGLGGVRRWAFGSVTDEVVHRSHIPVLVIPPHSDWIDPRLAYGADPPPTGK